MRHRTVPLIRSALLGCVAVALAACAGGVPPRVERAAPSPSFASPSFRPIELETRQTGIDVPPAPGQRRSAAARGEDSQPPARRPRAGSSSPPPDPAAFPPAPRPVPLPLPPSTQSATDAFKRDLLRPEADRMRADDALGRLDPLQQRDLMRRELELRQLGDPLAR